MNESIKMFDCYNQTPPKNQEDLCVDASFFNANLYQKVPGTLVAVYPVIFQRADGVVIEDFVAYVELEAAVPAVVSR